jgi:hypothetical protein
MKRLLPIVAVLFASISLTATAAANDAILHDSETIVHDGESIHHDEERASDDLSALDRDFRDVDRVGHDVDKADEETSSLVDDAERADGLLDDEHVHDDREHERDHENEASRLECDRLEFDYYLRHPPGTKPSGLRGLHGCALWRADARWHDEHPQVVSVLGDNIDLIP